MKKTDFINVAAADWAKTNIKKSHKADVDWGVFTGLFIFFAIIVILFVIIAISFAMRNDEYTFFQKVFLRTGILAIFFTPFWIMIYLTFRTFKRKIKLIDSEGVVTVLNKRFKWEKLYFINYATYRNYTAKRNKKQDVIEVVFENGKTETFHSNREIANLLGKIPAERRRNGVL